ncbi:MULTISPECIES: FecR family protein [Methylosinus]|uniref:Iron dicitrate transport regulator FecR n=1 Tax=Methylosinus trichosporium (strain ATCC 35070 / NCIMB 11131 / UNIQEM 75 / OB3b) TaxID=595536 RepID=A0A2D2D5U2_METT3|nr:MULTISPECIES: FecR family protein [Methylosinus]ATQ70391.1 iron dicitrate transport regulator FecR [Methylosinus trichosporium OB3b]OBS51506.1 iron dicitrate transport regulator FecR [Methylosinus sp. 3S-1]
MTEKTSAVPHGVREAAIDWWLKQTGGRLTKKERSAFEAWLAEDDAHRDAYAKLAALGDFMTSRWPGAGPQRKTRRRRRRLAAAVSAAALALFLYDDISLRLRSDLLTGPGETRQATLSDGSRIELDARSAVALNYTETQRRVTLLEGEAWFDVAPDATRPFVVEAAGGTTTALGTAFDVAVENGRAHVTVTSHSVRVASGGGEVIVEEGQQSAYGAREAVRPAQAANVDRATAWRRGRLMFEDRPLGDVVRALARYHRGFVYFVDPALRARRVTGVFNIEDPIAALDEIETSLGLHATHITRYLTIIHQ